MAKAVQGLCSQTSKSCKRDGSRSATVEVVFSCILSDLVVHQQESTTLKFHLQARYPTSGDLLFESLEGDAAPTNTTHAIQK